MRKDVTMADIAKKFGVSNVTVSKALADKDGVSEDLREKIKAASAEMGYRQNSAKTAKDGDSANIGVIIPSRFIQPNGSFYWALYNMLIKEFMDNDYYCIMEILDADCEKDLKLPKMISDKKVAGLVVLGQVSYEYCKMLNDSFSPLVFLDFYDKHLETDSIVSDGYFGSYLITDYLFEMGHTKIGFVGTLNATSSIKDRFMGYARAHLENGVEVNRNWIVSDRDENGMDITYILPDDMPTAFVCNCDETAYKLIKRLKECGYRVPDDISVVGYDNYLISDICEPAITTIEVNVSDMAKAAVRTISKRIENPSYRFVREMIVGNLIVKDSVKCLK